MKIKPTDTSAPPDSRIDGVSFGNSRYGCIGNFWHYPTSSPSFFFTQCNAHIRRLDLLWDGLTTGEKADWEDWTDELSARELCLLLKGLFSDRSPEEAAKAGFVNCNCWRITQRYSYTTVPPVHDALPDGDSLAIESLAPFKVAWTRTGGFIDNTCYMAVFYKLLMHAPSEPISAQKLTYLGTAPASPNGWSFITDLTAPLFERWPNKYCQFAFCNSVVNSCPFESFQLGTVLTV